MKKNGEHFVTCGQMKVLERRADENGLSYYRMMENAGSYAASMIMEPVASYEASEVETPKNIYVFCGKGNNGGDGFVVARLLHDKGHAVTVILVDGEPKTQDAITNLELVRSRDIKVSDLVTNNRALLELPGEPDIIVDAIYGTGFKGKLMSNGLKASIYINNCVEMRTKGRGMRSLKVVSLDIPSGIGGDVVKKDLIETNCVKADMTVTFHAKKPVHIQKFSEYYCGKILVADIGIDEEKLWNIEI